MEDSPELHEEILDWANKQLKELLNDSKQPIYIYVCDRHKICNEKFSSMLGYKSPKEWSMSEDALSNVKEEDQPTLVNAYQMAMENKTGSSMNISWKNTKGNLIKTQTILVPLMYKSTPFALHFINKL